MKKDYYEILGVSNNSSKEDIKRAYHILAHQYHPDKNNGNDKRFKEINEAYRILSGDSSRAEYDKSFNDDEPNDFENETDGKVPSVKKNYQWAYVASFIVAFLLVKGIIGAFDTDKPIIDTSNNHKTQIDSVAQDNNIFPMNESDAQYGWYDKHNVPMAYRCYIGSNCSEQDWAYAVYNNKNDSRGATLKAQADDAQNKYISSFPAEKCVTEYDVKICDLSHSVQKTYGDGTRGVNFQANAIDCIDMNTGKQSQNQGNIVSLNNDDTYCASDLGGVYIDPTLKVGKYFNKIIKNINLSYEVPSTYEACIWTYQDGNGAIPYIEVSNNVGPSSGFNVRAFCKNGNNQVDIYSSAN